jgi:2-polyprenyl-6-hydroxyphenyl methylase/3-demethylubiquinone-9 3-methyltransferase
VSRQDFLDYTLSRLESPAAVERYASLKERSESVLGKAADDRLDVLELGCSLGVQSRLWARSGHRVCGLDLDDDLLKEARRRAEAAGLAIRFSHGSAERLPFADGSFDVVLSEELLEHVGDWRACLDESCRVLRSGGLLVLTTTNVISPRQHEFALPLYSWWPPPLKRRAEHLARTTRPALARYTSWPAIHWFSPFGLARELRRRGLAPLDRVDVMDLDGRPLPVRLLVRAARALPPLKAALYLFFPGTVIYGRRP